MKTQKSSHRNNRKSTTTNCYLHECNVNTYAHIINKPPVFRLRPPPNPLNFNLNTKNLFSSSNTNLVKNSNENEQFLIYYLNLNESITTTNHNHNHNHHHHHSTVNVEKCTNLRLYQIASHTTYSLTNKYAFKNLNGDFVSPLKNATSPILTVTDATNDYNSYIQDGLNTNTNTNTNNIATNLIKNVHNDAKETSGLMLFSSMTLVAISIMLLIFYLYYHYFHLRYKNSKNFFLNSFDCLS
jgi:hypothetical protein